LESGQAPQCCKGRFQALYGFDRSGPAEIPGGNSRQEIEPDIGGRRPRRNDRFWILLEIVRREHVLGGGHESLEESPSPARDQAQRLRIVIRSDDLLSLGRSPTGPERQGGRP